MDTTPEQIGLYKSLFQGRDDAKVKVADVDIRNYAKYIYNNR